MLIFLDFVKFNRISREGNTEKHIKSYKDQFREHMIRNEMWGVFSFQDPRNQEKTWDVLY